jgi:hypothetical protein
MAEPVTIAGHAYAIGRLDPRKQFHIARRLAPIMEGLVGLLSSGSSISPETALGPIARQIAGMPDADVDYIISNCLAVCSRESTVHGAGWSPVQISNGKLMFEDIDMGAMLQLVAAVVQENLGDFFAGLGRTSASEGTSPQA